jgi:hypothetical protein
MRKLRNTYQILVGKLEGTRSRKSLTVDWGEIINMNRKSGV